MHISKGYSLTSLIKSSCTLYFQRNIGVSSVILQKVAADPIQKLFVDKVKEYAQKSKSSGDKLFEASPEIQKEHKEELNRLEKQYGGGKGVDLAKFPTFNFQEPTLDSINLEKKWDHLLHGLIKWFSMKLAQLNIFILI